MMVHMERQLVLLEEAPREWRLDDRTREVGRRGVAAARQALRQPGRRPAA
ncbi:MAG TPA: hypothetical protein VKI20_01310 [Acidimicrobiales bacterium]|nr:hypothetical protein [Acidimicrobiales bacterium]